MREINYCNLQILYRFGQCAFKLLMYLSSNHQAMGKKTHGKGNKQRMNARLLIRFKPSGLWFCRGNILSFLGSNTTNSYENDELQILDYLSY